MAKFIKGNKVANATSYELFKKVSGVYTSLKEASDINFDVDALGLASGDYTFVVKAKASGYEDSEYSNEVICTIEAGGGGSSEPDTPTIETTTYYGTEVTIINDPLELDFVSGYNAGTKTTGFTTSTGRSCSITQCVAVTGGSTLVLSQPISGVTLTYGLKEYTEKPLSDSTITSTGQTASSWLSGNTVLQNDTKYIVFSFKRGNGSSDFSEDELTLLKQAITIS